MEYHSAIKRNEITAFAETWIEPETIMLTEVSQTVGYQYHMLLLLCGIYKKHTMNFLAEQILTHQL